MLRNIRGACVNELDRVGRIGLKNFGAYQDAAGRLFGPQVMYQIAEPGGWNLDAVEDGRPLADASFETPERSLAIALARGA